MKLCDILLENYRNIENESVSFDDGVNIIYGKNAQGKTNIIEGIYLFARGRSFRAKKEEQTIAFDKEACFCQISYEDIRRKNKMTCRTVKGEGRKLTHNGVHIKKTSEFIGNFRAVLFSPDSLSLIKSSPSERRLFLDVAISQLDRKYVRALKSYNMLLSQRNALLKQDSINGGLAEAYAEQMSGLCGEISVLRAEYLKRVGICVEKYFSLMSRGRENVRLGYECDAQGDTADDIKKAYFKLFTENIQREAIYKTTLYGIQRDDINIELNGKNARLYCSQGQMRSLALSLKLAEGEISRTDGGEEPVYLLDDVFGELDEERRRFLLGELDGMQVIITCCDMPQDTDARLIHIDGGKII